jgi:hypothetical protein
VRPPDSDRAKYEGVATATAARAIVDAATDPEQIARAGAQAVARRLATWPSESSSWRREFILESGESEARNMAGFEFD